jgi:MGT family glycosyltransferase
MKQLHIGFVSYPFPAFVNPTVPLVSTLVRRGYRVSYATSEAFATRIAALGAETITCPAIPLDRDVVEEEGAGVKVADAVGRVFGPMVESVPKIREFYELHRPDLILHSNLAMAGHILGERLNIPRIQYHSTFALDKENLFRQIRDPTYRKYISEGSQRVDRFLHENGVASKDFAFARGRLTVLFVSKFLQPLGDAFGPDCIFAGRCAGEQSYQVSWRRRDTGGRPVVLVATSTMFVRGPDYFNMCIEALKELPVHVILSIGPEGRPECYDALPAKFEVVQHVPHAQILPHVDLFIFLSGTISTSEAIYHGVPMLVTSHGYRELEWQGENIDGLGIGIHLRKSDMSTATIKTFANQILSDSNLLKRVRHFQEMIRRDPGSEEVANHIEEYMAEVGAR